MENCLVLWSHRNTKNLLLDAWTDLVSIHKQPKRVLLLLIKCKLRKLIEKLCLICVNRHVTQELISTEETYTRDLDDILQVQYCQCRGFVMVSFLLFHFTFNCMEK